MMHLAMNDLLSECRKHGLHDGSLKEKLIARAADEIERLRNRVATIEGRAKTVYEGRCFSKETRNSAGWIVLTEENSDAIRSTGCLR